MRAWTENHIIELIKKYSKNSGSGGGGKNRYKRYEDIATPFYDLTYEPPSHINEQVRLVIWQDGRFDVVYRNLIRLEISGFNIPVWIDDTHSKYQCPPGEICANCSITVDMDGYEAWFKGTCGVILDDGSIKKLPNNFDGLDGWLEVTRFHGVGVNQEIAISVESVDTIRIQKPDIRLQVLS